MATIRVCRNILAPLLLLSILTATQPIGTCSFSIHLTPIDSVLFPKNLTLEERLHAMAEISRNRAFSLMSMSPSARAINSIVRAPILPALSNFYVTRMVIGSNLYSPYLMVDTGSDTTWVQCEGCKSCFALKGDNFKYRESSSYHNLPCNHPLCVPKICDGGGQCLYNTQYTGGSNTKGWVSTDIFTFLSSSQTFLKFPLAFGCGYDNQNIRFGENYGPNNIIAGILGLGAGQRSMLMQLVDQTRGRFSYCLPAPTAPRGTHTFINFGDEARIGGSVRTTQLLPAGMPSYYVNLLGISIDGRRLPINPELFKLRPQRRGGFAIDSGTPYTVLAPSAYRVLKQETITYVKQRYRRIPQKIGPIDFCYVSRGGNDTLPSMTYHFEGGDLLLYSRNVWKPILSSLCMYVLPTTSDAEVSVLGAFQQGDYRFLFDVPKSTVSFAPEFCR